MARTSFRKLQTPNSGSVLTTVSFHDDGVNADGYISNFGTNDGYGGDAYGGGVHGVLRVRDSGSEPVGEYEIWLDRVYKGVLGHNAFVACATQKVLFARLQMPVLETRTGSDSVARSVVRVQILNSSGVATDPSAFDEISVWLHLDQSGARV